MHMIFFIAIQHPTAKNYQNLFIRIKFGSFFATQCTSSFSNAASFSSASFSASIRPICSSIIHA